MLFKAFSPLLVKKVQQRENLETQTIMDEESAQKKV